MAQHGERAADNDSGKAGGWRYTATYMPFLTAGNRVGATHCWRCWREAGTMPPPDKHGQGMAGRRKLPAKWEFTVDRSQSPWKNSAAYGVLGTAWRRL